MDLRSRLDALREGTSPSDPADTRVDAVLRALPAPDVQVLGDVLDRWERAGHSAGSVPTTSDLEPDDTGNVVDTATKTLIATAPEWETFQRVLRHLG